MMFSRHIRVLKDAWSEESRRRKTEKDQRVETEFLPAALEVLHSPPSPAGRLILWLIIVAVFFALGWAVFGRVDVVAVSEGRVMPSQRIKTVESSETGRVRQIYFREGDEVSQGEALIALDPTFADADADVARTEFLTAQLSRARARALLRHADGALAAFSAPEAASPAAAAAEARVVESRIDAYEARREGLRQRRLAARSALRGAQAELARLQETYPLIRGRYETKRQLFEKGLAPSVQLTELEEQMISTRRGIEVQQAEIDKAVAEIAMLDRELDQAEEEFRGAAAAELTEAEAIVATREESVLKATQRASLQVLTAPVDGVINEVAVATIGEVVEPGAPLMTIVPGDDELIVEALVLNKDIGVVRPGREAVIKLEAYPFTRFGYLHGVVETVSADAITDEARGLVFPARVRIRKNDISVQGRTPPLTAGMTATVEIKTGHRRILSFLLSPIAKAVQESGRER